MTTEAGSQGNGSGAPADGGQGEPSGVTLGTPAEGTQGAGAQGQQGSPGAEGTQGSKLWYDGLVKDADNLKTVEAKKWASPEDAIKSYRELETRLSQGQKAQAPSDPKEYAFTVPKEAEGSYSTEFADTYRNLAHKAGLSKEQAAAIHDGVLQFSQQSAKAAAEAQTAALTKSILETKTELEQVWGAEKSPEFNRNLEMSRRALSQLDPGLKGALEQSGIIVKTANGETITNAAIFKALAKVGATMFSEDSLYGSAAQNTNPFAKATENLKAQGDIFRTNPERAKLLIQSLPPAEQAKWAHVLGS